MTDLPTLRLLPKVKPQKFLHGMPWVYQNELVMDRRARKIPPGTVGRLEDHMQNPVGIVAINPNSKITARILDTDPNASIDADWLHRKISAALGHRTQFFDAPFYRLIHAEADGLPGVIVDRFDDVLVIQPNAAWADMRIDLLVQVLMDVTGAKTVIMNGTGRARTLEGLEELRDVIRGDAPTEPIAVPMNGATYFADLMTGQKTGIFYDQRPNHAVAAQLAKDAHVLDVFSHIGGFGLSALGHGAASADFVDASQSALDFVEKSLDVMGKFGSCHKGDAFDVLGGFQAEGKKWDMVICDPPAFAPSKQALEAGLRAYEKIARLGASLVAPGGVLVLCSCSHAADLTRFQEVNRRGVGRAGRTAQLFHLGRAGADHPQHLALAESSYLKSLFYRMQG